MSDTLKPTDLIAAIEVARTDGTRKTRTLAEAALGDPERFIRDSSKDLCKRLDTSEPTLIRFCQSFGYAGLSEFRIDLALAYARDRRGIGLVEPLHQDRRQVNVEAKRRVAAAAQPYVEGDRTLLIDSGSTAELFAHGLAEATPKTIMTTSLMVAQILLAQGQHEVMLTGGRIRPNARSLSGRLVDTAMGEFRFDTFVMGVDSIHPVSGFSTFREDEAQVTRALISGAERVLVLADRTKFSKPSLYRICGLDAIDRLVSDLSEEDPVLDTLRRKGVEVGLIPTPPKGAIS